LPKRGIIKSPSNKGGFGVHFRVKIKNPVCSSLYSSPILKSLRCTEVTNQYDIINDTPMRPIIFMQNSCPDWSPRRGPPPRCSSGRSVGFPFRFLRPELQTFLPPSALAVQFLRPFDLLVLAHDTSLLLICKTRALNYS